MNNDFDKVRSIQHILRNPHGKRLEEIKHAQLAACNELDGLIDAYSNMRDWAVQNGVDVTTYGGKGAPLKWTVAHNGKSVTADSLTKAMVAARSLRTDEEAQIAAENLLRAIDEELAQEPQDDLTDGQILAMLPRIGAILPNIDSGKVELRPVEYRNALQSYAIRAIRALKSQQPVQPNCREFGPCKGVCIQCANGIYAQCRYLAAAPAVQTQEPILDCIEYDPTGKLVSADVIVGGERVTLVPKVEQEPVAASSVPDIKEMVNRFLGWPLPKTVLPDQCVMNRDYPNRSGTNLLTAVEAKAMFEYCLRYRPQAAPSVPDGAKDIRK